MPITNSPIQSGTDDCYVRVFYDFTFVPGSGQTYLDAPLVNNTDLRFGPIGYCLLVVNISGQTAFATVYDKNGIAVFENIRVPQGNPVTSGQARSRTAAQMNTAGYSVRGDIGSVMFQA